VYEVGQGTTAQVLNRLCVESGVCQSADVYDAVPLGGAIMAKQPLFPHVPKRKAPLFPHGGTEPETQYKGGADAYRHKEGTEEESPIGEYKGYRIVRVIKKGWAPWYRSYGPDGQVAHDLFYTIDAIKRRIDKR
jgi:hypothetical protein